jgi:hypothetical protein
MTKFRIKRILPDGTVVVQPGWSWGGCRGNRIRAIKSAPFRFERGAAIELSGGAAVVEECLLCDVTPAEASAAEAACLNRQSSAAGTTNAAIANGEECSWS